MTQHATGTPLHEPVDNNESGHLIDSRRVEGTRVYGPDGSHVGDIDHLMIDKQSGKVAYAIMSFGGFLGIGDSHYPVPWPKLKYSVEQGGYVTDITEETLENAPEWHDRWHADRRWQEETYRYYQAPWIF